MHPQRISKLSVVVLQKKTRSVWARFHAASRHSMLRPEPDSVVIVTTEGLAFAAKCIYGSFQGGCPPRVIRTPTGSLRRPLEPHFALTIQQQYQLIAIAV